MMPDVGTTCYIQIAEASEKESNRKYLLKVTQTVQYLARPGWPLKEDGNEIDSNFAQLLLLRGNRSWSKARVDTAAYDQHAYSRSTYTITIAIVFNWSCS